ncbi:hypothetical protein CLOSTMETH_02011 [[Clostridium] methylpentosum DSM 5476]|uniref:Uncharacterized protein n=1 Tax=[Clostridium] methylpentosum DSM 5476 TaxID=537013 RepID=C0EDT2_9FIRM|nr:hypothetical protein CLOSTMETH_02011 [[Clostridium] methylpentosum DSM 5476]
MLIRYFLPAFTDGISPEITLHRKAYMVRQVSGSLCLIAAYASLIVRILAMCFTRFQFGNDLTDFRFFFGGKLFAELAGETAVLQAERVGDLP